jgi:hypothetical protein
MQAQNTFLCTGIAIFSGFVDVKMFSLFYTGTKISSWICTSINKLSNCPTNLNQIKQELSMGRGDSGLYK